MTIVNFSGIYTCNCIYYAMSSFNEKLSQKRRAINIVNEKRRINCLRWLNIKFLQRNGNIIIYLVLIREWSTSKKSFIQSSSQKLTGSDILSETAFMFFLHRRRRLLQGSSNVYILRFIRGEMQKRTLFDIISFSSISLNFIFIK